MNLGPNLAALYAESSPGFCICCDGPLPQSKGNKPRKKCGNAECERVYLAASTADRGLRLRKGKT